MQDQPSLTLRWCTYLNHSCDAKATIFAKTGGQHNHYGLRWLHSPWIIHDSRPNDIDAQFALISRMGQWAWRIPLFLPRQPILSLWRDVTMQPVDCWSCTLQIVDHPMIFTFSTTKQTFHSKLLHGKIHVVSINSQYIDSMNTPLHLKALLPLNFWSTTLLTIWAMDNVAITFRCFQPAIYGM
jgi:hypothetical protein